MNILLISPHRCGSTTLMNTLGNLLQLNIVEEPWNYYIHNVEDYIYPYSPKSSIVKSLVEQKALQSKASDNVSFYLECIELFDRVIILSRKDRVALAESYARQMQFGKADSWHEQYTVEHPEMLNLDINKVNTWCDDILKIANYSNIPITWYEDLYSGDIEKIKTVTESWGLNINIKKLSHKIHPKYKYRKL